METIELTFDAALLAEVDRVTRSLAITRAAFVRLAVERALHQQKTLLLEQQHAEGYRRFPIQPDEFDTAESELAWGEP